MSEDTTMVKAFDVLGAQLNAQLDADMREMVDLWDVWQDAKADYSETRAPIVGVIYSGSCDLDWFVPIEYIGRKEP